MHLIVMDARRLGVSWPSGFGNTPAVVDDVGPRAVASALVNVGGEAIIASEAAGIGARRALGGRGGFAVRRVGTFLLVLVGVDLCYKVFLQLTDTELLRSGLQLKILGDEDVESRETDASFDVNGNVVTEIKFQFDRCANIGGMPFDDVLVKVGREDSGDTEKSGYES